MPDDPDDKSGPANSGNVAQTNGAKADQGSRDIGADELRQSVARPSKREESHTGRTPPRSRFRRGTVPTVEFPSSRAEPLEDKALRELVSLGKPSGWWTKYFGDHERRPEHHSPRMADLHDARADLVALLKARYRESLRNDYVGILLNPNIRVAEGFLHPAVGSEFSEFLKYLYLQADNITKFAINNNKLYIGIVSRDIGSFYKILVEGYGFEQFEATKLACAFDAVAAKALVEGVEAAAASFASQGSLNSDVADSPASVTARFAERADKSQSPLEFLELHYGRWLRGKGLYQHTLRKLDKSLMQHLDRRYVGRRDELAEIIPNKRAEIDARLGPDAERMTPQERKRALDALRMKI